MPRVFRKNGLNSLDLQTYQSNTNMPFHVQIKIQMQNKEFHPFLFARRVHDKKAQIDRLVC